MLSRVLRCLATIFAFIALSVGANAQVITISQSFTGATLPSSWNYGGTVNNSGTITPFAPTASGTSAGMTMTTSSGNESTYAYDPTSFNSANATISVQFTYTASNGTATPADGITFFLADASVVAASGFSPGAFGGSLGYAQKNAGAAPPSGVSGLNGGYLGVGIDEFGNYSNPSEGRIGGPGSEPNNVAVRGPGSGQSGYDYLGGTTGGLPNFSAPTSGSISTNFEMTLSATNQLVMYMQESGVYVPIFTADLSGYARPNDLIMGFTGSTGGANSTQQVANVVLTSVASNLWTNNLGTSNWGDVSGSTTNWNGTTIPATGADILLDNTYVNSAQNINVGVGQNRIIRSLQIDAPFNYTLNNGSIEFNNNGVLGPSGIFVSQTHGSATQTVNSNLKADNAIEIKNGSSGALNLTGTLNNNGNTVTFDGTGTGVTTASGVISGSGSLVKSDSGSVTLSGANTYTGGTTLNAGTLTADNNSALGTGGLIINGGTLASDSNNTVNNTITLKASAGLNNITTSGTLTQNGGSYTLTMDGATQSGAVNLSESNTGRTLTVNVDNGYSSTISGVIQNGGTGAGSLTKTGAGTLTLSGADTYTGTTSINAGTIQLGASNVLSNSSNLTIAGGNLNLNGKSDKVNNLSFSGGATLDFGSSAGTNSFVFNNISSASGVLTINNYVGPDSSNPNGAGDFLGTLTNNLAAATLNQIYFSGYGTGSTENNGNLTNDGNGGTAYRITPTTVNWGPYTWVSNAGGTGQDTTWDTAKNWQNNTRPNGTTGVYVDFGTGNNTNVSFNGSNTVNAIRFDSSAASYTITDSSTHTLTLNNGTALAFVQQQSANNQTLSPANITIANNVVFDVTGAGNLTVGAAISDGTSSFSLTKTGNGGKLILTSANAYDGGTSIQNGTIQIQNRSALGTGTVTISNGATLETSNSGSSTTNAMTLTGTGVSNNGAIDNVAGNNGISGTLTLAGASRINSDSGTLTLSGGITGANTNLNLGGAGNITVSSAITTGVGAVTLDGTGTVTLSGAANTYTGLTTVSSGILNLSKAANTTAIAGNLTINGGTVNETATGQIASSSTLTVNGGTFAVTGGTGNTLASVNTASGSTVSLTSGSTLTVNGSGTSTLNGVVSGAGALSTTGTGSIILAGNNTYSGGSTLASIVTASNNGSLGTGAVAINSSGNLQVQSGVTLANNFTLNSTGTSANDGAIENISGNNAISGTVTLGGNSRLQSDTGTLTLSNTVSLGANTLNVGGNSNTTLSGVISGTGALTKDGTGNLTLSGANTFTGATTVSAGTLTAGAANVLNTTSGVTISSGATLALNNFNETIKNLNSSGTLDFGSTGGETLTLTGTNTLAGTMASAVGTLVVGSGATLTLGASFYDPNLTIVLAGGTLNLNGTNDTFGSLQITGNSVLDFSSSANSLLNVSNVSFQTTSLTLSVTNWANAMDYFYSTNQNPSTQGSAPLNQVVFTGFTGNATKWLSYTDGPDNNHQLTPVPEPSTYGAVFTTLCLGLFALRRKKIFVRKF